MSELTPEQVKELAKYLDEFPPGPPRKDVYGDEEIPDQYWRQLAREVGRVPRAQGRVQYTVEQVEGFAMEELGNRSPSRKLLRDLIKRKKPISQETLISCLQRIRCLGAENVFKKGSEFI